VTSPAASTAPQVASNGTVQAGTRLVATLDTPVGTEFSKVGDTFTATIRTPVVDDGGMTLIAAGSKVIGRVAELRETRGDDPAVVELDIEALAYNGITRPLNARIVDAQVESTDRKVRGKHVAGGAAGGAILGAVLGGGSGALKGAALGAGTGALISLGTSKTGAKLPSGTTMAIEVTQATRIE
jgi:hypothetical protein